MTAQEVINPTQLVMPEQLEVDEDTVSATYAKFELQPLERGFGPTIGNALRRTLLSSMIGAAIETVRMEGVQHEFSTVPGVVEDVPEMVLNLKGVRLRLAEGETSRTIRVIKKGPAELVAGDFGVDSSIEIVNTDHHVASLDDAASLDMELTIGLGRGFSLADERDNEEAPIGTITIDAIYSPVRKVNFVVSQARVGQLTDYDALEIEVWTDGTITPQDAIASAAKIVRSHLGFFLDDDDLYEERASEAGETSAGQVLLAMPIDDMELSVRSANCLKAAGIQEVEELVHKSEADMLKYRNFGRKSLTELNELLTDLGLRFGMRDEEVEAIRAGGIEALKDLPPPPPAPEIELEDQENQDDQDQSDNQETKNDDNEGADATSE